MADSRLIELSGSSGEEPEPEAAFYFDLSSPECWLVAERVIQTLGRPAPWIPVLGSALPGGGDADHQMSIEQVAQLAANRGLLPVRAPAQPQVPTAEAMMAATFAQQSGKVVAYTLAAMRQCWCAGRDLSDHSTLFLAGAASEIHPNALEKAFGLKSLRAQLDRQTSKAAEYGVTQVPAIRVGRTIHFGDSGLTSAAVESL